jgi:ParB family chromosome partitioning protein
MAAMAMKKHKGLGRGLEALLGPRPDQGTSLDPVGDELPSRLPLADLVPGSYQPRTRMDEGALYELAESIKAQGIMQAILVRPLAVDAGERRLAAWQQQQGLPDVPRGTRPIYEIIAGERRFRAARLAGLEAVPVLVRDVPDDAAAAMALIENIQREDLNPLEEAQGLQRLVDEFDLTHEQAAQAVGRSRSAASNLLRLLRLAAPVQGLLMAGDLDMGHARALLALDGAAQIGAAQQIVARQLSVRQAEGLVRKLGGLATAAPAAKPPAPKSRDICRIEEALSDLLTAEVEVRIRKRVKRQGRIEPTGEIAIRFASLDELNGLIERLRGGETD